MTRLPQASLSILRDHITNAYRMEEKTCLDKLLSDLHFSSTSSTSIKETAETIAQAMRLRLKKQGKMKEILHHYDLSSEEGVTLMCLAEALLRIPDKNTLDKFISDKLTSVDWKEHLKKENSLFVNAATWSLFLTGSVYSPLTTHTDTLYASLTQTLARLGTSLLRPLMIKMMKMIGNQFVLGQDISSALAKAKKIEQKGYYFSFDMLGEAARTEKEATAYYEGYQQALIAIKETGRIGEINHSPSVSIKLSALHPRYEFAKRDRILGELPPLLLNLAEKAKQFGIQLTIDAEEADRLDLSLDIFEILYSNSRLQGWEGLGLALQAYQKRASFVIDWLSALTKKYKRRILVRLVKGAYWDSEIKTTQIQGFSDYPVFTRKTASDVSYLACAKKLLSDPSAFYPQFGTHNAYSIAAILAMGEDQAFEFQCLYGMGEPLYEDFIERYKHPVRMYAPVGTHQNLLGYLVRRLLENGANTSFINQIANPQITLSSLIPDPIATIKAVKETPHPLIPKPSALYGAWENSQGIDLSNRHAFLALVGAIEQAQKNPWVAASIINGQPLKNATPQDCFSPADNTLKIGEVYKIKNEKEVHLAIDESLKGAEKWAYIPHEARAEILEKAAQLFQVHMPVLIAILIAEGGKCIPDAVSEIRETIDYCRYYAYRARLDLAPRLLPGPTGEDNLLTLHPRGVFVCISPWNFPLAIFMGQILAALVTGNVVIAKPAEQTPLIAFQAIQILYEAGIPSYALSLLLGSGSQIGPLLTRDSRIAGVIFTGSTQTAKSIEQELAHHEKALAIFIAETGGQNAMIVDSSALLEQVIIDISQSAFNSAGQRCSALRVLYVQEEIALPLMTMLKGYMAELKIGNPHLLSTDIGPVINEKALEMLNKHWVEMKEKASFIAATPMPSDLRGYYFAPCAFELSHLSLLKKEIFGPFLHVIRYKSHELDKVMQEINSTGYGLTLGIHSRIEATQQYIIKQAKVGNIYVNRNMIGAVVGVQPFGGEGLSGTGPKAGGPYYLPRLCVERTISTNTSAVGGNTRLLSLEYT